MSLTTLVVPNFANPRLSAVPESMPESELLDHVRNLLDEFQIEVDIEYYANWMLPHSLPQFN